MIGILVVVGRFVEKVFTCIGFIASRAISSLSA